MKQAKQDSLKKRYFFKLAANVFSLGIGFFTQLIIPRGLGPRAYGDFNFLTNFFSRIAGFLDMGSSIGFYTKLSQRKNDSALVSFYLYFMSIAVVVMALFVIASQALGVSSHIWPDQRLRFIYLALILGICVWVLDLVSRMADAYGLTVKAEIARVFQRIISVLILIGLFMRKQLNLSTFFYYNYIVTILLIVLILWVISRYGYPLLQHWRLKSAEIKHLSKEFYRYCHPLFVYNLLGMLAGIFDRWLLQRFAGSIQQGFFGLSYQIGAICFLFSSAMTPIITREFSIAYGGKDMAQMAGLFRRHIPLLYSMTAFFACFVAVNADKVTLLFAGGKFTGATLAVTIMAFYPIHQTYGQLSGAVFYATEQTRLYRNIGIFFMLIGIILTYFLIAPKNMHGLNAGANGLAVKLVLLQFVGVNVHLYFNARLLKISFLRYFAHQIVVVGCLLACAFLSTFSINCLFGHSNIAMPINFLSSGLVYTIAVFGIVWYCPVLFGLKNGDIKRVFNGVVAGIRKQKWAGSSKLRS